jgi:hypothetical protein
VSESERILSHIGGSQKKKVNVVDSSKTTFCFLYEEMRRGQHDGFQVLLEKDMLSLLYVLYVLYSTSC